MITPATALRVGQEACAFPRYKFDQFYRGLLIETNENPNLDLDEAAELVIANLDADSNCYPPVDRSRINRTLPPEREGNLGVDYEDYEDFSDDVPSILIVDLVRHGRGRRE